MSGLQKVRGLVCGKYGPFCSHRCKLIDLGKWLDEEHSISELLRPGQLEKTEKE
jgi:endogenous inhibitor of DNA gyrase (YacG/DUF329 family)